MLWKIWLRPQICTEYLTGTLESQRQVLLSSCHNLWWGWRMCLLKFTKENLVCSALATIRISKKYWQCRSFFFFEQALKPCWNLISMSRFKNSHLYISLPRTLLSSCHLLLCLLIMCEQKHSIHSALGTRNHCKSFLSPCGLSGRQIQSKHEFLGIYYKYIMWLNCACSPAMDLYSLSLRTPIFPAVIFPKGRPAHWALFKRRANLNTATI